MRLRFLWIGETKEAHAAALEDRYLKRIQRFLPVDKLAVTERKKTDPRSMSSQLGKEALQLREKLPRGGFLVALDERGDTYSSMELARFLEQRLSHGTGPITFLAGGHAGLPEDLLRSADLRLSLSKLTFPHEMARVILLEQVYRALSILKGLPYHK